MKIDYKIKYSLNLVNEILFNLQIYPLRFLTQEKVKFPEIYYNLKGFYL